MRTGANLSTLEVELFGSAENNQHSSHGSLPILSNVFPTEMSVMGGSLIYPQTGTQLK